MSHTVKKITGRRASRSTARQGKHSSAALRVSAEVHDDEFTLQITFDAARWFRRASDDEIRGLAAIEWGGNREADEVAQFARSYDKDVRTLFDYLGLRVRGGKDGGYECHVNEADALAWCATHRPHLFPDEAS